MMHKVAELRARRANGEKGFTLIELIVVLVIIGILVAIAAVAYNGFINNANQTATKAAAASAAKIFAARSAYSQGPAAFTVNTTSTPTQAELGLTSDPTSYADFGVATNGYTVRTPSASTLTVGKNGYTCTVTSSGVGNVTVTGCA